MLYKGKRDGYYLYELTETDLIWQTQGRNNYHLGNVLLFKDKKHIELGKELMKADDLETALDYLENGPGVLSTTAEEHKGLIADLKKQLAQTEANLGQRDELLHDLSDDLESQRYSNQVLIAQLENLREQISIEQITRDEVLGDLEVASAETYRKDVELQKAIDAKTQLEQELAERICELLELDSANTELQKRLQNQKAEETSSVLMNEEPQSIDPQQAKDPGFATQVYTMSSGKQIQIYHEFPKARNKRWRSGTAVFSGLTRVLIFVILGVFIFLAGSTVATAELNGISLGEALDLTLSALLPW